jgi:hypothetical protein
VDRPGRAGDRQVVGPLPDQGAAEVDPVDVQLGQREPLVGEVGLHRLPDRPLGRVGRRDPDRRHQPAVQVAQYMPFVAVDQATAALAPVAHLRILDADAPLRGDPLAQGHRTGRRGGGVLRADLVRRRQARLHGRVHDRIRRRWRIAV